MGEILTDSRPQINHFVDWGAYVSDVLAVFNVLVDESFGLSQSLERTIGVGSLTSIQPSQKGLRWLCPSAGLHEIPQLPRIFPRLHGVPIGYFGVKRCGVRRLFFDYGLPNYLETFVRPMDIEHVMFIAECIHDGSHFRSGIRTDVKRHNRLSMIASRGHAQRHDTGVNRCFVLVPGRMGNSESIESRQDV